MSKTVTAAVGIFATPEALLKAVPQVREKGLGRLEAYTPYPVHGLDQALGVPRSPLGYMVLGGGLAGVAIALVLQGYTSAVDYPLIIGGKPFFAWPAYVPIIFELMVLLAAFTAFFGMIGALNRLPFFSHSILSSEAMAQVTRDRYALAIEAPVKSALDAEAAVAALEEAGADLTELLYTTVTPPRPANEIPLVQFGVIGSVVFVATVAGWGTHWAMKLWPDIPPNVYMHEQRKLRAQNPEAFFLDQKGMRTPPEGTVARGYLPYPFLPGVHDEQAGKVLANPLPFDRITLHRGRKQFETHCKVCHGVLGDGSKTLSAEYLARPANLHSNRVRQMPDGQVFHVISVGKGTMPGYQSAVKPDDRWAIVHYLRALQRSQNASDADLEYALQDYIVVPAEGPKSNDAGTVDKTDEAAVKAVDGQKESTD